MRRRSKVASVLVAIILTLGMLSSTAEADKGGEQCLNAGAVVVTNSISYTCTKVNKKLKWVASQRQSVPSITIVTQPATPAPTPLANPFSIWIEDVVRIVNKERSDSGLDSLSECPSLDQSAQLHSQDMNARDFFDHTNPDGKTPSDRIRLTGYFGKSKSRWTGENIAAGFKDATSVMAAWMKSPGHRANILNSKFTHLGVGIAGSRSDSIYGGFIWTQNFGSGGTC